MNMQLTNGHALPKRGPGRPRKVASPAATTAQFTIDHAVPLPSMAGKQGAKPKYPFASMKVGDSFFAPGDHATCQKTVVSSSWSYGRAHGKKFATSTVEENGISGVRIWRIK
jgi:hypothetical protein